MSEFLCLLRGGGARMEKMSRKEKQAHMAEWQEYMGSLATAGCLRGGAPLDQKGRVVKGRAETMTDGPHSTGGVVGGYLIVEAKNLREAVKFTKGCPIHSVGGAMEIRPIASM